jgi:glycosyltransferase involved in cell wall biosynthesis
MAKKLTAARRLVHTAHRSDEDIFTHNSLLEKLITHSVDKVVGVSEAARLSFIRNHGFPKAKTTMIYNGINISLYEAIAKRANNGLVIGTVMNFADHKDYDTLILAFDKVLKTYPDSRLILVGDGPNAVKGKELVQGKGITDKVIFMGFRKDVPDLLRTFDVFVISSHTEGLGLAILESMAARVPVVVSYVEGANETIEDGVSGMFFEHGNFEELKDIIISLHENGPLYDSLAENGYRKVASEFSSEKMYRDYKNVYEELHKA